MAAEVMATSLANQGLETDVDKPIIDKNGCDVAPDSWKKDHRQAGVNNQQRKGHRRKPSRKKRKWKPYNKLSWQERKALEEKEKFKAVRIREEMKEKGRPVAPYNTTQYLMDEHNPHEGGFDPTGFGTSNITSTGTDEGESFSDGPDEQILGIDIGDDGSSAEEQITAYTDSPHMASEFISQDFSETYERVHEESLNVMTREELLQEHMALETKFNELQEELSETKQLLLEKSNTEARAHKGEKDQLKREIERLMAENKALKLGKAVPKIATSDGDDPETIERKL